MDIHEWPCRIKSARQKRRLVKTDRDKQLIQLDKTRQMLWQQKRNLPMVPLEHPYQRGWKRVFVLRDDIRRSPMGDFYEALLKKVNTVQYHHDRSFKFKKRRKRRYGYTIKKQGLLTIDPYYWGINRLKLSEKERACFTRADYIDKYGRPSVKFVITEPWRYVLKVLPNMITETKLHDEILQQEISAVKNHIENHFYQPRIHRLTVGKRYSWRDDFNERPKYINKFKNIPRYAHKEAYLELET